MGRGMFHKRATLYDSIVSRGHKSGWVFKRYGTLEFEAVAPDALLRAVVSLRFVADFASINCELARVALDGYPTHQDISRALHDLFGPEAAGYVAFSAISHTIPEPNVPCVDISVIEDTIT